MPKIIKIQILTLKIHFFTDFVNFYQKAIIFNYASPQKISEEDIKAFLPNLKVSIKNPNLIDSPLPSSEGKELATPLLLLVAGILLLEGWTVRRE